MREAQAAASLRSPHVVQILDYGVDDTTPFIVMELLEGETLAERLKRVGRLTRPRLRASSRTWRAPSAGRTSAGIAHRDLKPENVFLVHNEDDEIAKVLDFGVAKVEAATLGPKGERTRTGSLLGTPYYMSPEQAQGNKEVDFRSDLWALGVIAFECLTGKRPFESEGLGDLVLQICVRDIPVPSELAPLPKEFDAWFAHACSRDPEQRFASAREMADALRDALGETRETIVTLNEEDGTPMARPPLRSGPDTHRADPPSAVPTARDPGAAKDAAHAATVVASPSFRPSALDAQAALQDAASGEVRALEPEPPSRAGMLLAVAGIALLLGLVGGFIMLGQHKTTDEQRPLPDVAAAGGAGALTPAAAEAGAHGLAHAGVLHANSDAGKADAEAESSDAGHKEAGAEAGAVDAAVADAAAQRTEAAVPPLPADAGKRRSEAGATKAAATPTAKAVSAPAPATSQAPKTPGPPAK